MTINIKLFVCKNTIKIVNTFYVLIYKDYVLEMELARNRAMSPSRFFKFIGGNSRD